MGSTMISCLCNFCAPPHQLEVNPILTDLLSATGSQPKLPIAANVSPEKGIPCSTTKYNLLHTHKEQEEGTARDEREPLKFGIEKILYSSSSKEFNDQHLGVSDPPPHSTSKRCLTLPWSRPVFTSHQRMTLENCFQHEHYLTKRDRYCLSLHLGLTEHQIKIWFQNRRVKYRHEQKEQKHGA